MTSLQIYFMVFTAFLLLGCGPSADTPYGNPPAEGFNAEASDERAITVADEVMEAMGGRIAWESTRYIRWNFFGRRLLTWDKKGERCRIEIPGENLQFLLDLNSRTGKVARDGVEMTQPDSIDKYVQRGYEIWINDSYWLVMPFKLKDSGVTLKYAGKDTTSTGAGADVLELTFAEVGVTPDNKYNVYVDDDSRLVTQWDFYTNYTDSLPRFSTPWADYSRHGLVLLSGNRGNFGLSDIVVYDDLPDEVFEKFEPDSQ